MDRFADLMDLRGDRSRLDAYFAGHRGGKQRQQQPPVAITAAATACMSAAVQSVKVEEDVAEAAAAAASGAEAVCSQPEPWHHEGSAFAVSEPATPQARVDSCGDASEFDGLVSEWDAVSEGSPPPEGVADDAPPGEVASAGAAWATDAGPPGDELQAHGSGAVAATQALRAVNSCPAAVSATPPITAPDAGRSSDPAGQQAPPADTALRDSSRLAGDTSCPPAAAAEARAADDEHGLDGVSVREQELIMAMIAARNARRGGGSVSSPAAGGSTASALSDRGGNVSTGTPIAVKQSTVLPPAAQASCSRAAAEDGMSPLGRQKRQRTLAGFLVTPAQSCKF